RNPEPAYTTRPSAAANTGSPALPLIARPLFFASSKPLITAPDAGQVQFTSSSGSRVVGGAPPADGAVAAAGGIDGGAGVIAGAVSGGAVVVGAEAAGAGRESSGRASTRAVFTPRALVAAGSVPGGATRITCPTSSELGLSMLFQR